MAAIVEWRRTLKEPWAVIDPAEKLPDRGWFRFRNADGKITGRVSYRRPDGSVSRAGRKRSGGRQRKISPERLLSLLVQLEEHRLLAERLATAAGRCCPELISHPDIS